MLDQNFSTNEIALPDDSAADTHIAERPDSSSILLGANANVAPDKSIRTSCLFPAGSVAQTNSSSDDGDILETTAKNMVPGQEDTKAPPIQTLEFFSFHIANMEKASLDKSFIFLLQVDEFGLRFATKLAKTFNWTLIPGLLELSEEACNRMLYSRHDASAKDKTER
jgi:hypothetical protein